VWAQFISGVGVRFAAHHPEHLRALVVVDGGVGLAPASLPTVRQRLAAVPAEFNTWGEAVAYYRAGAPASVKPLSEERSPYTFRRLVNGKVTWKYDPVAREHFTGAEPPSFIGANPPEVWEKIRCPILFVLAQGGGNGLSLEEARHLAQYGDGSRWVEVPNTKHWIHEENLDGFLQSIQPFFEQSYGA
jgi:pimeloyl-ACP methyl ester carboxylesterase